MSNPVTGPAFSTAVSNALDDGVSNYKLTIFNLGVAAGQWFSQGWPEQELEKELSYLSERYPQLAKSIRAELASQQRNSQGGIDERRRTSISISSGTLLDGQTGRCSRHDAARLVRRPSLS